MARVGMLVLALYSFASIAAIPPRTYKSPYIRDRVLYIEGYIDSHIYDYLAREVQALASVDVIELNSLGGNSEWALNTAQKIRELKKTTRLSLGNYCLSACAILFAAGLERTMDEGTEIGVHGVRLHGNWTTTFQGLCFIDLEAGPKFEPGLKGCKAFVDHWYNRALLATEAAFTFMEEGGVSEELRTIYWGMPDDEKWFEQINVLRKPDWFIDTKTARELGLATQVVKPRSN